jgi:hypothetical protein
MRRAVASGSTLLVALLRALASEAGHLARFSDPTATAVLFYAEPTPGLVSLAPVYR